MKKTFIIIFIGSLLWCCSDKKSSVNSGVLIDLEKETPVSISDLFESIDVVQLETNNNCLINKIDKVIYNNNRYYVFDSRQQMLFCFDSTGKYLFNIDKKGQGPEEYIYIEDFNIDVDNNHILLLEPFGHLLTFDMDGHFVSKIRLPSEVAAYNEVYLSDKDNLIFFSFNEYNVVFYSKNNNRIVAKWYMREENIPLGKIFYNNDYDKNIYYYMPPTNNIINLSDSTIFSWNFGNKNNTQKQIENYKKLKKMERRNENHDYVSDGVLNYTIEYNYESRRYRMCFLYMGNYKYKYIFYDKTEEKSYVFEKIKENVNFIMPNFSGESLIVYDQELNKNPYININYYNLDMLTEEQQKIINSHKDEDNPFLVKYNLKK